MKNIMFEILKTITYENIELLDKIEENSLKLVMDRYDSMKFLDKSDNFNSTKYQG